MRAIRLLSLLVVLSVAASVASADTITSTGLGGPWAEYTTWVGGVVPDGDDDVIIVGPVEVTVQEACLSLNVHEAGSVTGSQSGTSTTLEVGESVFNAGTIADGLYYFYLQIGGDLHNEGSWSNRETTVTGVDDRQISHSPSYGFHTNFIFDDYAAGDLIAVTPLEVDGYVDVTGGRLTLQPDCPFTLDHGVFNGELIANGNEMRFESWSYLEQCTLDDVVLVGDVEATFSVVFTTRVTVMGILQNGSGGGGVTVEGDLINHGSIQNDNYSFFVRVTGDVENYGSITNPQLELQGVGVVHHLIMGPGAILDAMVFLPEFEASTLIAETPVSFDRGLSLGVGKLILEHGASLHFGQHSGLGSGTIQAGGNTITTETGNSGIGDVTIDRGVFGDYAALSSDVILTNGMTVDGTLATLPWAAADLTVEGLLRNNGTIRDGDHPLGITVINDIENLGVMENSRVVMAGYDDQAVGVGSGIAVPEFVLESGLEAVEYQWFLDGAPLTGETGSSLTLVTVGPADYGSYHCVGDDAVSRVIDIDEFLQTSSVRGVGTFAVLERNHPNPFNPRTDIAFSLAHRSQVSLAVYDVNGREVVNLIEGELDAGRHQVAWQPRDLPSGTYVYRLQANGEVLTGKCAFLR